MKKITYILLLFTGILTAQVGGFGNFGLTHKQDLVQDRESSANGQRGYKVTSTDFDWGVVSNFDNTIIEIRHSYDLDGDTITLPSNVTLKFNGGVLKNGTIEGDKTKIKGDKNCFEDIILTGSFTGVANVEWFDIDFSADDTVQATALEYIFTNTPFYKYYIPHECNYGLEHRKGVNINDLISLPNRNFIIIDDSKDNSTYAGNPDYTQGGQTRVFYQSTHPTNSNHDSFDYKISNHHIGSMYMLVGDGVDTIDSTKARNATTFYGINGDVYWGVGMGSVDGLSTDSDLELTPFKIVSNKLRGDSGLAIAFSINNETANVGYFAGAKPTSKWHFRIKDGDNQTLKWESKAIDDSYPVELFQNVNGDNWGREFTDDYFDVRFNSALKYRLYNNGNGVFSGVSGGAYATESRPIGVQTGTMIFDTTIGKPIWYNGTNWVDATGETN